MAKPEIAINDLTPDSDTGFSAGFSGFSPDSQSTGGAWTLTSGTAFGLTSGTYTLYAQAEDSYGIFGDAVALTLQVL